MRMLTCATLLMAMCLAPMALAATTPLQPTTVQMESGGKVIGSGSTYQEAYKDAQNRLPAGKYAKSVRTWKSGETWYCEMTY